MRAIETTATVTEDGKLTVQMPPGVPPGEHRVVVVIDEQPSPSGASDLPDLPAWPWHGWPADATFRREDLYGDDGR